MDSLKLATVWLGGCSGCHMSFLDLDEFLIELAARVEVVYSPLVDPKEYPTGVDVVLVEGAVCNEDHIELAHRIRERTRIIIAFGDCAVTGNVTALRNQLGAGNADRVLQRAYIECADVDAQIPREPGVVPPLLDRVVPLHEIVHVDHYLPGCPPPADRIKALLQQVLDGARPQLTGQNLKFG